jgi:predicted RND superfamily exporter protein
MKKLIIEALLSILIVITAIVMTFMYCTCLTLLCGYEIDSIFSISFFVLFIIGLFGWYFYQRIKKKKTMNKHLNLYKE